MSDRRHIIIDSKRNTEKLISHAWQDANKQYKKEYNRINTQDQMRNRQEIQGNPLFYPLKAKQSYNNPNSYPIYDKGIIRHIPGLQTELNPLEYPLKNKKGKIIQVPGLQLEQLRYDLGGSRTRYSTAKKSTKSTKPTKSTKSTKSTKLTKPTKFTTNRKSVKPRK